MPRPLTWLLLVVLAVGPIAACGGSEGAAAGADGATAEAVLRDTFAPEQRAESGKLDLRLDAKGTAITLRGPFATRGERVLPDFAFALTARGWGQDIAAGATSTGDAGFLRFEGRDYELPTQLYRTLRASVEQGQRQGAGAVLGLDPARWITSPRHAGEAKVGEDATLRITGGVDVPRMLEDLERLARLAGQLGGGSAPGLDARERREIVDAVRDARVEVFTGAEDRVLRRLVVTATARDGARTTPLRLELTLTDVNEDQDIEAPTDARPLHELLQRFGGMQGLTP